MFQIDQATAASSLPTPATAGTQGYFTNGNPASGVAATIVDADWLNMIQQELVNVVEGGGETPSKTTYNQVLLAIKTLIGQPQNNLVSGVVGATRNLSMSVTAASATATLTADEIIVETALGGLRYCLPSFSKTINLATTGAGGMDTGSAPVSGFVALYAIYNPTTQASALLATNATSAVAPNVYGGANMPAGYTASALVSVWRTNNSSQFTVGIQDNRTIYIIRTQAVNLSTATAASTALSISTVVPMNAREVIGDVSASSTGTTLNMSVGSTGAGNIASPGMIFPSFYQVGQTYYKVPISTSQTIYYYFSQISGTFSGQVNIAGYTF